MWQQAIHNNLHMIIISQCYISFFKYVLALVPYLMCHTIIAILFQREENNGKVEVVSFVIFYVIQTISLVMSTMNSFKPKFLLLTTWKLFETLLFRWCTNNDAIFNIPTFLFVTVVIEINAVGKLCHCFNRLLNSKLNACLHYILCH